MFCCQMQRRHTADTRQQWMCVLLTIWVQKYISKANVNITLTWPWGWIFQWRRFIVQQMYIVHWSAVHQPQEPAISQCQTVTSIRVTIISTAVPINRYVYIYADSRCRWIHTCIYADSTMAPDADRRTHISMLTAWWQTDTHIYADSTLTPDADKQIHVSMLTARWQIDTCIYADSMLIPDADKQIYISMLTACWHQMLTNRYTYLCWQHLPRNTHMYANMCWYQTPTETFIYVDSTCHRVLLLDADKQTRVSMLTTRWCHVPTACTDSLSLTTFQPRRTLGVRCLKLDVELFQCLVECRLIAGEVRCNCVVKQQQLFMHYFHLHTVGFTSRVTFNVPPNTL